MCSYLGIRWLKPGSLYNVKEAQPPIGILLNLLYIGMVQGVVGRFWYMVLALFKVDDPPGKMFIDYLTHLKVADRTLHHLGRFHLHWISPQSTQNLFSRVQLENR